MNLSHLTMAQLATVAHTIASEPLEHALVREEIVKRLQAVLPDRVGPKPNSPQVTPLNPDWSSLKSWG